MSVHQYQYVLFIFKHVKNLDPKAQTVRHVPFRSVPFRSVPFRSVPFRSVPFRCPYIFNRSDASTLNFRKFQTEVY